MAIRARLHAHFCLVVTVLVAVCASHAADAASPGPDNVSLSESTIAWSTVKYATKPDNGFVDGSLDLKTIVDRTFKTWVLENRYLKVTLLPDFGGPVLSFTHNPAPSQTLYPTR